MSEPVSNAEIEDVLSSIRRLVSENSDTSRPSVVRVKSDEKLVLTPDFRVLDTDVADVVSQTKFKTTFDTAKASEAIQGTLGDSIEEQSEPTDAPELASIDTADLGQKIEALEAAIGDSQEEWEPDGSELEAVAVEPIVLQRATPAHVVELRATEAKDAPAATITDDEAQTPTWQTPNEVETDEVETDEVETDEVETVETVETVATVETGPEDILADDISDPEDGGFLDEEMLREMVTQLVREELRGHIGERITRNVRRLVRREIKRALDIRDLE